MMHRAFAVALIVLAATPPHGAAATTYTAAEVDESCPLTTCNGDKDLLAGCVILILTLTLTLTCLQGV